MTVLTDPEFVDALTELRAEQSQGLPPVWAAGECDACGDDTDVRVTAEGLTCQDCADAEPYDHTDDHDYLNDDWELDR